MSINQQTIEKIVVAAVEKHFAATNVVRPQNGVAKVATPTPGVSLIDAVITAEVLEQHLNGDSHFQIGKKSLLTPTAHDYIRAHGLNWSRASVEATPNTAGWLAIIVTPTAHVSGAIDQLSNNWRRELLSSVGEAARMAVSVISRAEAVGVAIISNNPRLAACLGNRSPNIRATSVTNSVELDAAIQEIGANVIAIDPSQLGGFQLRQLLGRFHEAGTPQPPVNWEISSRLW